MNGIYFLANERVLDWVIAATASIRAKGCTLPILIIPFDEQVQGLAHAAEKYNLQLWNDPSLQELDELGKHFYPNDPVNCKMFRRLASFWGPFDNFVFSDVDVVALMNWTEIVDTFVASRSHFWYFGLSAAHVYKPGPLWDSFRAKQRGVCFNGGFFASRHNVLSLRDLQTRLADALAVRSQFVQGVGEQAFFNFCLDTSEVAVESASTHIPNLFDWNWAPSIYQNRSDFYEIADRRGSFQGKRFPLIHWAGFEISRRMPHRGLFLKYRMRGASFKERLVVMIREYRHPSN